MIKLSPGNSNYQITEMGKVVGDGFYFRIIQSYCISKQITRYRALPYDESGDALFLLPGFEADNLGRVIVYCLGQVG